MSTENPPKPPISKAKIFFRRLTSSVVLWTLVILSIFSPNKMLANYVFLAFMLILAGLGLFEFYELVRKRGLICFKGWGIFGGLLLMTSTFLYLSGVLAVDV